jgi:TRAP-type C4-dicarboxylate transport system permease small subunit
MRYVVATIGAIFIFVAAFVICAVACAIILPEQFNQSRITIRLGWFYFWASPSVLIGGPLAMGAAILTFRATLRMNREIDSPDDELPQKPW